MIAVVLAALSGLVWGVGDFAGGKASQRIDAVTVVVLSKAAAVPLLLVYLVLMPATVHPAVLGWGAAAGVFGVAGMMVFYRAMAGGAMTIVAPVSAVTTALLPVGAGLLLGERPGGLALAGAGCAIAAIGLVSLVPGDNTDLDDGAGTGPGVGGRGQAGAGRLLGLALGAGVAFGLFFICLSRAGDAAGGYAGMWPVLGAQLAALAVGGPLLVRRRRAPGAARLAGAPLRWLLVAGMLDMTANALYIVAVQSGDLSIIAPIASLYPVSTVLLAMLVDRERLRPVQLAGLGLAATALVLVAS
ncbi:DMT family transporter [Dactylosporangium aurantiacum]|uniref:DMT family transporter n=1 Tax=Dactylosporangium aurantiacum TaxID=35754 RepID=A0A9Q9MC92_9ACTN|nr:DMT family transporter [Dactylosporangium aurantiacum]MDG6108124.1 DMT family transporter [Dactylosporangium aurantiacum]UWZ53753.1 DMT family transporter [Dactylosporangium aurantiacum]